MADTKWVQRALSAGSLAPRALSAAGRVARYLPNDNARFFAFLFNAKVRENPWPLYRRLHERGGALDGPYGITMIGSHAGVTQVLRHSATSVREELADLPQRDGPPSPFHQLMNATLLFTDAPEHTRQRSLVSRAFTPKRLESFRSTVEAMAAERVHALRPAGAADLMADLALPMPVDVICALLGVPTAERPQFLTWARHLGPALDVSIFRNEERERLGDEAALGLRAFLLELIADPSRRDPEGLLSALVEVEDEQGDRLSPDEITTLAGLLLVAGFETTTNLIVNGLANLLHHPDQLARLRDGEVGMATAIEELLRYEGPVQFTQRTPTEDLDIDGHRLPKHKLVALLIGAANHDPSVFDDADGLDLGRDPNPHLAFSSGVHFCLGATLARMEAGAVIGAVLDGLPDLRLVTEPSYRPTFVLRGRTSLPLSWRE